MIDFVELNDNLKLGKSYLVLFNKENKSTEGKIEDGLYYNYEEYDFISSMLLEHYNFPLWRSLNNGEDVIILPESFYKEWGYSYAAFLDPSLFLYTSKDKKKKALENKTKLLKDLEKVHREKYMPSCYNNKALFFYDNEVMLDKKVPEDPLIFDYTDFFLLDNYLIKKYNFRLINKLSSNIHGVARLLAPEILKEVIDKQYVGWFNKGCEVYSSGDEQLKLKKQKDKILNLIKD